MAQQRQFTPYEQHQQDEATQLVADRRSWRGRKLAPVDNLVSSWEKRPLLCRLHIHRPVVWRKRTRYHNDLLPPIMPHCGRCGYEWDDYF